MADPPGGVYLQLHVRLHSLRSVNLDPLLVGSLARLPGIYSVDAL